MRLTVSPVRAEQWLERNTGTFVTGRPLTTVRFSKDRNQRYITPDVMGGPKTGTGIARLRSMLQDIAA